MYPDSAISAAAMIAIAAVMVAALAFWLGAVYYAAREPHRTQQKLA